ncbi:hypothetical protein NQ176_g10617 [Zarea fungicola]|uniref:Uncharacterized protein n=1 Tax=Zarea fungicola TaxID=93591 RepID=A0ACC1MFJ6_9HYPO|nr:hypothetical protein NQ176_g10617 [Lecanicillium fungicola]
MEMAEVFAAKAGLTDVQPFADGLEFNVYRATSAAHGQVVLRVPKFKIFQNANDPNNDARDLVHQEAAIFELLAPSPVPVPQAHGYYEIDGYPAMVCDYVPDDSTIAADAEIGRVAALVHATAIPADWEVKLVAMEGYDSCGVMDLLVRRMVRRFERLIAIVPEAKAWAVSEVILRDVAEPLRRFTPKLLHMDLRQVNVRMREGHIVALFDWTNALLGPPAADVYRSLEWGTEEASFLEGYRSVYPPPAVSEREEIFLRLDAALVLALVFVSEAPDPEKSVAALRRVQELGGALNSQLASY